MYQSTSGRQNKDRETRICTVGNRIYATLVVMTFSDLLQRKTTRVIPLLPSFQQNCWRGFFHAFRLSATMVQVKWDIPNSSLIFSYSVYTDKQLN